MALGCPKGSPIGRSGVKGHPEFIGDEHPMGDRGVWLKDTPKPAILNSPVAVSEVFCGEGVRGYIASPFPLKHSITPSLGSFCGMLV